MQAVRRLQHAPRTAPLAATLGFGLPQLLSYASCPWQAGTAALSIERRFAAAPCCCSFRRRLLGVWVSGAGALAATLWGAAGSGTDFPAIPATKRSVKLHDLAPHTSPPAHKTLNRLTLRPRAAVHCAAIHWPPGVAGHHGLPLHGAQRHSGLPGEGERKGGKRGRREGFRPACKPHARACLWTRPVQLAHTLPPCPEPTLPTPATIGVCPLCV